MASNGGGPSRLQSTRLVAAVAELGSLGHMSTSFRVLSFGVISGLLWSLIAGFIGELFRSPGESVTVIVSGVLSGVIVSFALVAPLAKSSRGKTILLGALSLPLGAFVFGVLLSLVQWLVREFGGTAYRNVANEFAPFTAGFEYAVLSVISIFAVVFFPLAVLTTFLLRRVLSFPTHLLLRGSN